MFPISITRLFSCYFRLYYITVTLTTPPLFTLTTFYLCQSSWIIFILSTSSDPTEDLKTEPIKTLTTLVQNTLRLIWWTIQDQWIVRKKLSLYYITFSISDSEFSDSKVRTERVIKLRWRIGKTLKLNLVEIFYSLKSGFSSLVRNTHGSVSTS